MDDFTKDRVFAGAVPKIYESALVPLIFEPYADDMARRVAARQPARLLEVAAGTGAVTRKLAARLPAETSIVATDLNQPMLDEAAAVGTVRPVTWRQADASDLPFDDGSFDAAVCQFGTMFFPDKPKAFSEVHRVLAPGGTFFFNVWDGVTNNEFAQTLSQALAAVFPDDPPNFLERTPYGYSDRATIEADLARGGFSAKPRVETVTFRSRASSARVPAMAFCHGTSMRGEIEARDPEALAKATDATEAALIERFGTGPIEGKIQALVVTVSR
jgi:SAM-dependent methyltransferase